MKRKYFIIFIFVLLFVELPLLYLYYTGQQRAVEKTFTQIESNENIFINWENPKYRTLNMEKDTLYRIVVSSTRVIDVSITDQEGFLAWQKDPESLKPIEFFYLTDNIDFLYTPEESKIYYFIFAPNPLIATDASISFQVYSLQGEVEKQNIKHLIEPVLVGTSVLTILLFIVSILPKGGLSRKKIEKNYFVLSEEAKTHDISYLKEFKGFTDHEINVLSILSVRGHVTEKDIPSLFDVPTFYNLYKMGFIEKIKEL